MPPESGFDVARPRHRQARQRADAHVL